MNIAIVTASNRPDRVKDFVSRWHIPTGVAFILVQDGPEKTPIQVPDATFHHYCWKDIDEELKDNAWIIPRQTDAIRSYGFYKAWQGGAEMIATIDDDCYPLPGQTIDMFLAEHALGLENQSRWMMTTKGVKPRGVPYYNCGESATAINMGFWRNVADLDAPTQLVSGVHDLEPNALFPVPPGLYYPMCNMNLSFKRDATPLMYHLLMGKQYRIDRFGDIWAGIISKKICDHLHWYVRAGSPAVWHDRASNVWDNLEKEVGGLRKNEDFWERIDKIAFTKEAIDAISCYREVATSLGFHPDEYFRKMAQAMMLWTNLFI